MSITDELREWASNNTVQDKVLTTCPVQHLVHGTVESLLRIADRIDTEHEHEMEERADRYSELRAKMNNCYIELPKAADGEYVHIGDRMESGDGDVFIVSSVDYGRHSSHGRGKFWMLWNEDADFYERADECRHHHAPTVEDVLDEFASAYDRIGGEDEEHQKYLNLIAEYAAKLRLAGDAE